MSKTNELFTLLEEMTEMANKMSQTAAALKEYFSAEKKSLSKTEVRELLVAKSNLDGGKYKADVKVLVQKYGDGGTFSSIKPESYDDFVAELEVIGNG